LPSTNSGDPERHSCQTSEKIFIADWVKNEGKKEADNRVEGVAPLCGLAFHLRHPAALVAEKLDGATAEAVGAPMTSEK